MATMYIGTYCMDLLLPQLLLYHDDYCEPMQIVPPIVFACFSTPVFIVVSRVPTIATPSVFLVTVSDVLSTPKPAAVACRSLDHCWMNSMARALSSPSRLRPARIETSGMTDEPLPGSELHAS